MFPGSATAPAHDPLGGSRVSVVYPSVHPGGYPGGYVQQSPMTTTRLSATTRAVTAPTTYVQAGAPAGASFVAPPRIVSMAPQQQQQQQQQQQHPQGGHVMTASYGAHGQTVQFRPSFVAAPGMGMNSAAVSASGSVAAPAGAMTMPAGAVMKYAPSSVSMVQAAPHTMVVAGAPPMMTVPSTMPPMPMVVRAAAPVPEVKPAQSASSEYVASLEKRLADLEIIHAQRTHSAFVFIKPHAVTDQVRELVRDHLASVGIFVLDEGTISAEEIDEQMLIDTHYGAIAAKAVKLKPADLTVQPKAKESFEMLFGMSWEQALEEGSVFNAIDGAEVLGITTEELGQKWGELQKDVDMLKFGGGFYCGKVENIFVINGFYLNMRSKFTVPGTCIYYFHTEWDARALSWADFRGKVLGATDPAAAEPNSARNLILHNWEALGLASCPDTGDNGVHASASPFEALAERANWLGASIDNDFFGRALLASGLPLSTIQEWCSDPTVTFEDQKQSLFDLLEDLNARDCLSKASAILQESS